MGWTRPVTNRTQADVDERTSRGVLNAGDLNRVEENAWVLYGCLGGAGGAPKGYAEGDFLYRSDLERIVDMVEDLRAVYADANAGFLPACVPGTPRAAMNHWEDWNAAEMIQAQLYRLHTQNLHERVYTGGEAVAGEEVGVL